MSITELSAESGVSVRTVRYYQTQALIPAPRRVGREVRYDASHLDALRLIGELQERGLRLATIREVLARDRHDPDAIASWLGLDASLSRPWTDDPPMLCTYEELQERLGGRAVPTDLLVGRGLIERRDDTRPVTYLITSTRMLDLCLGLLDVGVSPEAAVEAYRVLRERLGGLADDLVRNVVDDVGIDQRAQEGVGALADLVDQLRPIAHSAVSVTFSHEMERALREIARLIAALREAEGAADAEGDADAGSTRTIDLDAAAADEPESARIIQL